MKKTGKKLAVRANVICHLGTAELRAVAGGKATQVFSCTWPWPPPVK